MSNPTAITLHALGAETALGTGTAVDLGASSLQTAGKLTLSTGAVTDQLVALIETSPDNTNWRTVGTYVVKIAHTVLPVRVGTLQRYVRTSWTVSGASPSVAWELVGEAHVIYVEPSELTPRAALKSFSMEQQLDACLFATSAADDSLNGAFELPLTAWGDSLRQHTGELAVAKLFRDKGCDPNNAADKIVFDAEARAIAWFDRISSGRMKPPEILDTTPAEDDFEGGSYLYSNADRGWGNLNQ